MNANESDAWLEARRVRCGDQRPRVQPRGRGHDHCRGGPLLVPRLQRPGKYSRSAADRDCGANPWERRHLAGQRAHRRSAATGLSWKEQFSHKDHKDHKDFQRDMLVAEVTRAVIGPAPSMICFSSCSSCSSCSLCLCASNSRIWGYAPRAAPIRRLAAAGRQDAGAPTRGFAATAVNTCPVSQAWECRAGAPRPSLVPDAERPRLLPRRSVGARRPALSVRPGLTAAPCRPVAFRPPAP